MRTYKVPLLILPPNSIFVFGSNTQGRHGRGAALWAKQYAGAIYGQSEGRQGNSYAICTKDISIWPHKPMSKAYIVEQIETLYEFALHKQDNDFYIPYNTTTINLNGYTAEEMADMFKEAANLTIPDNIIFDEEFAKLIST